VPYLLRLRCPLGTRSPMRNFSSWRCALGSCLAYRGWPVFGEIFATTSKGIDVYMRESNSR
jgi:hypothetical protein